MAASENTKRNAAKIAEAEAPSPKKPRMDPKLEGIVATLQKAEYLNEDCRAMLVAMTSGRCLWACGSQHSITARQAAQHFVGFMMEETHWRGTCIAEARKNMAEAQAEEERSGLEGSKEPLLVMTRMNAVEISHREQQAAQSSAQSALFAAQNSLKTAQDELANGKEELLEVVKFVAALESEKTALTTVIKEHLRSPMQLGQGPHFNFLEKKLFTVDLGLEESLIKALPSSCAKTKEQRGGFDDLVIAEFEKALVKKVATLEKSIADEAPVAVKRQQIVAAAEFSLASKVADEEAATLAALTAVRVEAQVEALEANHDRLALAELIRKHTRELAQATHELVLRKQPRELDLAILSLQKDLNKLLSDLEDDGIALEPTLELVVLKNNLLLSYLKDVEDGTLATSESLRDKSVEGEAATAGA